MKCFENNISIYQKMTHIQTHNHIDTQPQTHTPRETDRQTDRQAHTHTHTQTDTQTETRTHLPGIGGNTSTLLAEESEYEPPSLISSSSLGDEFNDAIEPANTCNKNKTFLRHVLILFDTQLSAVRR